MKALGTVLITLCADCLPGYSRDGPGKCKQCGERGLNKRFLLCLGSVAHMSSIFGMVKRGGAFKNSDGAKKIFISFSSWLVLSTTCKFHGLAITWRSLKFKAWFLQSKRIY